MAAIVNTAPTRIVGGSDTGGKLKGDRVVIKALNILKNPKVGSLRTLFAKYIMRGKDFVFKTPERLIPSAYTATGGNKSQYGKVPEIVISTDKADIFKHPIETLDFDTQVLAEEEEARIAGSIQMAIDARLDADILTGLIAASTKVYLGDGTIKGPSEDTTEAQVTKIWRKISFQANALKGLVTTNTIGVDNGGLLAIVSNNLMTLLIEKLNVYTDKNTEVFLEGSEVRGFRIGNITIVTHIFLGQTFPEGSLIEGEAHDFKGVDCLLLHSEAYAVVFNHAPSMWDAIDPDNGNLVIGAKYQWGKGALRPSFIKQIAMYENDTALAAATATGTGAVISADIQNTKPNTSK